MKKLSPWILATTMLAAGWAAGQTAARRSTYTDANYGFSLSAPQLGIASGVPAVPVILFGPPGEGFSPNVNVMVQDQAVTRKEYRDQTEAEFKQVGAHVNSVKEVTVSGYDALMIDFDNQVKGKPMHFLNLAVLTPKRVYLVTATDTAEGYQKHAPEFHASLDSFKLTPR